MRTVYGDEQSVATIPRPMISGEEMAFRTLGIYTGAELFCLPHDSATNEGQEREFRTGKPYFGQEWETICVH